jgi:hypothetical protein
MVGADTVDDGVEVVAALNILRRIAHVAERQTLIATLGDLREDGRDERERRS